MGRERLQKFLARAGVASRRRAEELIRAGRVTVNGRTAAIGDTVDARRDTVAVDGQRVRAREPAVYIAIYKPRGVVSTTDDDRGRTAVVDLLPDFGRRRLAIAGRLDYHSEGLVLVTDDGELVERLTHPRYRVPRVYHAKVKGSPEPEALAKLCRGVYIEGGRARALHAEVLRPARSNTWIEVVVDEGRHHMVRLMCRAVGHPVQRLVRVAFGPVQLGDLRPGEWRELADDEVASLREGAPTEEPGAASRRGRSSRSGHEAGKARSRAKWGRKTETGSRSVRGRSPR